jgi:hypothetical protein
MGIDAIYPKMNLSKRNQEHKIYPYLLRSLKHAQICERLEKGTVNKPSR